MLCLLAVTIKATFPNLSDANQTSLLAFQNISCYFEVIVTLNTGVFLLLCLSWSPKEFTLQQFLGKTVTTYSPQIWVKVDVLLFDIQDIQVQKLLKNSDMLPVHRFIFHSDRRSSSDFFRNFKFVLAPNPALQGIKNLMNFLTWLIYPILPLWILHRKICIQFTGSVVGNTNGTEHFGKVRKYSIEILIFCTFPLWNDSIMLSHSVV